MATAASAATTAFTNTYLAGWVADVRKRVRFVSTCAVVYSCDDPCVAVFNDKGHFFIPHLVPGQTYRFVTRNGALSKRWSFTPRRGPNELEVELRTPPARVPKGAAGN
jgi:hypothetical protein